MGIDFVHDFGVFVFKGFFEKFLFLCKFFFLGFQMLLSFEGLLFFGFKFLFAFGNVIMVIF